MFIYSFHYLGTSLWSLCFPVWNICLLPIFLVQDNQRSVEFVLRAAFGTDGEEASLFPLLSMSFIVSFFLLCLEVGLVSLKVST